MGRLLIPSLVVCLAATAAAQPKKEPPPAPPSTGKELAQPKVVLPAQLQATLVRELIKKKDCKDKALPLAAALNVGGKELKIEEKIAGNELLAKCARQSKAWTSLLQASVFLVDNAPDKANPEDVIDAQLALGNEKKAAQALKLIVKKYPKHAASLTVSASVLACHKSNFKACYGATKKMLEALGKLQSPPPEAVFKNNMYHALAAAALGDWPAYDESMGRVTELAKARNQDVSKLQGITARIEDFKRMHLFVDENASKQVPLGTYHLMVSKNLDAGSLLTLRLVNHDKAARSVKVSVEIPGMTEVTTATIALPPGEQVTKEFTPPLKLDFDASKIRAARDSQIALKIKNMKGKTIFEQSYATQVLPRDHLPLRRKIGSDAKVDSFENSLAWITPNAPEVDAFLKKAKERLKNRTFSGEQSATLPQVKALFDELKAQGVSYVMDPNLFDDNISVQRTRLPVEVLASTNAQCLEGTLLYATLFEAIGLKPYLIYVPGHAFVAWQPSKYDKGAPPLLFLETTLTGGPATFEQAVEAGISAAVENAQAKNFELGLATRVDVTKLRKSGYAPQPY
jgi:hypothetical protein